MKTNYFLLTIGFLFSIILITFRIENGFNFLNIQFNFSLLDVSINTSKETYLTSSFAGYLFLLLFSLTSLKTATKKTTLYIVFLLSFLGLVFELKAMYDGLNGVYNGIHFRIGVFLTLIGFLSLNKGDTTKIIK